MTNEADFSSSDGLGDIEDIEDLGDLDDLDEPPVSEEQVISYLRRNADFLVRNPDLLQDLIPPAKWSGDGVVDMQQFILRQLRGEIDNLRETAQSVIETSRGNMSLQTRTHAAVLAMLNATDFAHLLRVVSDDLPLLLDVDVASVGFEPPPKPMAILSAPEVCRLPEGMVDAMMGSERESMLLSDMEDDGTLFGPGAGLVRSAAFTRLYPGGGMAVGLLGLGSRRPAAFHPSQGTELLIFLARVLERCIHEWVERAK